MRIFAAAMIVAASAGAATAGVVYTGGTYSENFDGLPATFTGTSPFSNVTGVQNMLNAQGVPEWQVARVGGTSTGNMPFVATDGTSNTGGIHSLGTVGSGERALGMIASGTNIPGMGVEIVNGLAITVTDVTIRFDREVWRTSTSNLNTMLFAWGVSGGTITGSNFLTDPSMTPDATGNLVGLPPVTTNGPTYDSAPVVVNLTGLNLAPGASLFLRWTDANDVGNDATIAIDNFNLTMVPAPGAAALLGLGLVFAGRRRR